MANYEFNLEGTRHTVYQNRAGAERDLLESGGIGCELGVMRGTHAEQLLRIANPKKLYLVDPWEGQNARYQNVVARFSGDSRVVILRCTAQEAMGRIPETLDWIFHDTAQYWPTAYTDLMPCFKKLAVEGLLFYDWCTKDRRKSLGKHMKDVKCYEHLALAQESTTVVLRRRDIKTLWPTRQEMTQSLFGTGTRGAEVGVLGGNHARGIVDTCMPSKMYMIDLWDGERIDYRIIGKTIPSSVSLAGDVSGKTIGDMLYESVRSKFSEEVAAGSVEMIRGDSVSAARAIKPESLDWVYIDAAHDHDGVARDLEAYYPKVKRGGVIAGHDFTYRVSRGGVVSAVFAFMKDHSDLSFIGLSNDRSAPSFALRRA